MAARPLDECFAFACWETDASMVSQMKAMEDENQRLSKQFAALRIEVGFSLPTKHVIRRLDPIVGKMLSHAIF